jgi:CRISPR system Cascade subunit CasB
MGFTSAKVEWIWRLPKSNRIAVLAELRRALTRDPGDYPPTWEVEFGGFPKVLMGNTDAPNRAELSVHAALTLYAVHQQSNHEWSAHQQGVTLGKAAAHLVRAGHSADGAALYQPPRRFAALVTANTLPELLHHARGMIQQLRSADPMLPIDYGILAADIDAMQYPAVAHSVRLRWARDFAWDVQDKKATATNTESSKQDTNGGN